jgi:phage virion morphogenesis protein
MTAFFEHSIDESEVVARLVRIGSRGKDLTPVTKSFGDYLIRETVTRFEQERDPDGAAWEPLSPLTLAFKKNTGILTETTDLRNSFSRKANRMSVKVGSDRPYAAVHQFGLKRALNISAHRRKVKSRSRKGVQSGVAFVRAHERKVSIPARPFLGFTAQDEKELAALLNDHLMGTRK